jgi:hypothetical protein
VKTFVLVLLVSIVFNGCKNKEDIATEPKNQTDFYDDRQQYPAIEEKSGLYCQLTIIKDSLSIQDTLRVTYSIENRTDSLKTYVFNNFDFQFSLKNESGRTIMKYPAVITQGYFGTWYIHPKSNMALTIEQTIRDVLGIPIVPGSYELRARVNHSDFPILMLSMTIK